MTPCCYEFPRPAIATDIAVFALCQDKLSILLIETKNEPFAGKWALPGAFLEESEYLDS